MSVNNSDCTVYERMVMNSKTETTRKETVLSQGSFTLQPYYVAQIGSWLSTFRDNISVPSSGAKQSKFLLPTSSA